ncbi:ABC transporter ATP-binding protein [Desulfovibrio inopinatus]|uniref:ABC transporter ATP-binding protein n=1 Tax=Desulfovibrio inopinatus TaxID=102109 RepID=UPI00041611D5|nr:ATP-binding cassette domain-containing protein [Desulfovibrio inopinatus]
MPPLFEIRHVEYAPRPEKPIFRDLTLTLDEATFTMVKGPSGSGKSSLLRLLCRLDDPSAGHIFFKGQDIRELAPPDLRRRVALLQQTPVVLAGSVCKNLLYPFSLKANAHIPIPDEMTLEAHLREVLLETVDLTDPAPTLSVGQKQRLCFVRALLLAPEVLLLDEPTSALDAKSKEIVETMAQRLVLERGLAVLFVTHDTSFTPQRVAPKTLLIDNGVAKEIT